MTTEYTYHANGKVATQTVYSMHNGRMYKTVRFYSTSGVYYNFFNMPA